MENNISLSLISSQPLRPEDVLLLYLLAAGLDYTVIFTQGSLRYWPTTTAAQSDAAYPDHRRRRRLGCSFYYSRALCLGRIPTREMADLTAQRAGRRKLEGNNEQTRLWIL
jgi:hypothetical protein